MNTISVKEIFAG